MAAWYTSFLFSGCLKWTRSKSHMRIYAASRLLKFSLSSINLLFVPCGTYRSDSSSLSRILAHSFTNLFTDMKYKLNSGFIRPPLQDSESAWRFWYSQTLCYMEGSVNTCRLFKGTQHLHLKGRTYETFETETLLSYEQSRFVKLPATWRNIPEDHNHHNHHHHQHQRCAQL